MDPPHLPKAVSVVSQEPEDDSIYYIPDFSEEELIPDPHDPGIYRFRYPE